MQWCEYPDDWVEMDMISYMVLYWWADFFQGLLFYSMCNFFFQCVIFMVKALSIQIPI